MKTFLTTAFAILLFTVTCRAHNTFPATGNVGIGTTAPTLGALQINGNSDLLSFYSATNNAIQFNAYNNLDFRVIQRSNAPMTFWTNTVERMRIDQSGGVGINTTTGLGTLDVKLAANQHINFISNTYGAFPGGAGILAINDAHNGYTLMGFFASQYFFGSGNVGIGTITPDAKLTVNGTVHSKAVVVDNNIFPDYVFNKTYTLRPLSAVKTYIDLNHHLPEMPSAAEVAKSGQNLREINALLLKKVEELTLYLINEHKANETLQTQVSELKSQMKLLTKTKR